MVEKLPIPEFTGEPNRLSVAVAGACWLGSMLGIAAFVGWVNRDKFREQDSGPSR